jgi:hypothetical protein
MDRQRRTGRVWLAAAAVATLVLAPAPARAEDARMAQLSAANQVIARRMLDSVARWDRTYRERAAGINGGVGVAPETLHRETEYSIYDVWVTRGPVIEKLGSLLAEAKKPQPGGRAGAPVVWSRFYSLDWHARTPLVGMLHTALVVQFHADGSGFVGGWFGVMNGTRNEEDMTALARVVDERFRQFGKSPEPYRRLMLKGPEGADPAYLRQPDPSGVSLYGPPVFPGDVARSFDLAEGLFEQVTDVWLEIVRRRSAQPFTAEDVARRDAMRKRWLTDQLYADPFASRIVPFEVGWLANMPPEIRF